MPRASGCAARPWIIGSLPVLLRLRPAAGTAGVTALAWPSRGPCDWHIVIHTGRLTQAGPLPGATRLAALHVEADSGCSYTAGWISPKFEKSWLLGLCWPSYLSSWLRDSPGKGLGISRALVSGLLLKTLKNICLWSLFGNLHTTDLHRKKVLDSICPSRPCTALT